MDVWSLVGIAIAAVVAVYAPRLVGRRWRRARRPRTVGPPPGPAAEAPAGTPWPTPRGDAPEALPEVVCFTAGPRAARFGLGVVHAWLAADRPPPVATAGISLGALNAAALVRALRAVTAAKPEHREAARWGWFRRYVRGRRGALRRLLGEVLPEPKDLFLDRGEAPDPAAAPDLSASAAEAARHKMRLVRLANWWLRLPLTGADMASIVGAAFRYRDARALPSRIARAAGVVVSLHRLMFHVAWRGLRLPTAGGGLEGLGRWRLLAVGALLMAAAVAAGVAALLAGQTAAAIGLLAAGLPYIVAVFVVTPWILLVGAPRLPRRPPSTTAHVDGPFEDLARRFRVNGALGHDYPVRQWLRDHFGDAPIPDPDDVGGPALLTVATILEPPDDDFDERLTETKSAAFNGQFAIPHGRPVDAALAGALTQPGLLPLRPVAAVDWLPPHRRRDGVVHLVDGALVRRNPLPALFDHIDRRPDGRVAGALRSTGATIRVVYDSPLGAPIRSPRPAEAWNIVDVGLTSARLAARRDVDLEIHQTELTTSLQRALMRARGGEIPPDFAPVDVVALAPDPVGAIDDAQSGDAWSRDVVDGCRSALVQMYGDTIRARAGGRDAVPCRELIAHVAPHRKLGPVPGLEEICARCPGGLPVDAAIAAPSASRIRPARGARVPRDVLVALAPPEGTWRPRVALVASGGVFRGAFQVGMTAAMGVLRLVPDVVVGASVGGLMGAFAARVLAEVKREAAPPADLAIAPKVGRSLARIAGWYVDPYATVAGTRRLDALWRQLLARLSSLDVSLDGVRRNLQRGGRGDSGLATVGAPSQLVDALARLLLIPPVDAMVIAREFVAGHYAVAYRALVAGLRADTIRALGIEHAIVGAELIEARARRVLRGEGVDIESPQPFLSAGVAFFATATELNREQRALLGSVDRAPSGPYDFVASILASSAFPAVFSPVSEADIRPGVGRVDRVFADGGLYDNLPFLPAAGVLSELQRHHLDEAAVDPEAAKHWLRLRRERPDLMLVAALEPPPETADFTTQDASRIERVWAQAQAVGEHTKIRSALKSAARVDALIGALCADDVTVHPDDVPTLNAVVHAGIHAVHPRDASAVNPTFALAPALGLDPDRVRRSIANGCYETLDSLAVGDSRPWSAAHVKAVRGLRADGRLEDVRRAAYVDDGAACPYFEAAKAGCRVACPFATEAAGIRDACATARWRNGGGTN